MQLIILAAGKGSRLPNKFRNGPKCMVKINGKSLLDNNIKFYEKFTSKTIVTGYKNKKLNQFIKKNNFKKIINKKFKTTNMVYSLFQAKRIVSSDVVICYGDIIFDKNIFSNIKKDKNIIPLYREWLKLWKKRMNINKIKKDAENVKVKNKQLVEIGTKITNFPKYQFMGIYKISKINFFKLKKFFKKNCSDNIDMTTFINLAIKKNIVSLKVSFTKKYWFEIDNETDIKITRKYLKRW